MVLLTAAVPSTGAVPRAFATSEARFCRLPGSNPNKRAESHIARTIRDVPTRHGSRKHPWQVVALGDTPAPSRRYRRGIRYRSIGRCSSQRPQARGLRRRNIPVETGPPTAWPVGSRPAGFVAPWLGQSPAAGIRALSAGLSSRCTSAWRAPPTRGVAPTMSHATTESRWENLAWCWPRQRPLDWSSGMLLIRILSL